MPDHVAGLTRWAIVLFSPRRSPLPGRLLRCAVAAATGEAMADIVFAFLTPDGAVERRLDDFGGLVAEVRDLLVAGREMIAERVP